MPSVDHSYELEEISTYELNKLLAGIPFKYFFFRFNIKGYLSVKEKAKDAALDYNLFNHFDKFNHQDKSVNLYSINDDNYVKIGPTIDKAFEKSDQILVRLKKFYQMMYVERNIKIDGIIYTLFPSNTIFSYGMLETDDIIPLMLICNWNVYQLLHPEERIEKKKRDLDIDEIILISKKRKICGQYNVSK